MVYFVNVQISKLNNKNNPWICTTSPFTSKDRQRDAFRVQTSDVNISASYFRLGDVFIWRTLLRVSFLKGQEEVTVNPGGAKVHYSKTKTLHTTEEDEENGWEKERLIPLFLKKKIYNLLQT